MISSISCLNKRTFLALLSALLLAACAGVEPGPPPLRIDSVQLVQQGAALEKIGALACKVVTSGGQGGLVYELRSLKLGVESLEVSGSQPNWRWGPNKPGTYQLRVIARDQSGDIAESGWSQPYHFATVVSKESRYAVLPIENLSDSSAPLQEIYAVLVQTLAAQGYQLLNNESLGEIMKKYRVRHVGGINSKFSRQLKEEAGVDGVLITALETWQDTLEPRISLVSRVVTTGENPEIAWIDSIGLTGDDAPGLLGIGRIRDYQVLLEKAVSRLLQSFQTYLAEEALEYRPGVGLPHPQPVNASRDTADEALAPVKKRFQPQFSYRASSFDPAARASVAVIPYLNINARKHAGKIVALHMVKQLHRYANLRVFEPGLVRETLLKYRMIMQSGPSLAAADVLASTDILGANMVVSGRAFDYQGDVGESKVDFSMQIFDSAKREVIWTSRSYATGNDGVYFFDWGKVPSAHGLLSKMSQSVVGLLEQ